MKAFVLLITIILGICACQNTVPTSEPPAIRVQDYLVKNVDSLLYEVVSLQKAIEQNKVADISRRFENSRIWYKKSESLIEHYFPGVAKAINGAALDKVEEEDDKIIEATGFQVVEEFIYPNVDTLSASERLRASKTLVSSIVRLKKLVQNNEVTDSNVFEAMRLQIIRMIALGLSGFDSPVSLNSLTEAHASLEGLEMLVSFYTNQSADSSYYRLKEQFNQAQSYLKNHLDFDTFDRASFITKHLNPLSNSLWEYQRSLKIPNNEWLTAVNMDRSNIFQKSAFDVRFFSPPYNRNMKTEIVELGKIMFFDPILSGNNSRSCASCHKPDRAFADPVARSAGFNFKQNVKRNAPTLINSGYQQNQFWDGRVAYLEDQVFDVVSNPDEMHGDMTKSVSLLASSPEYIGLFQKAFVEEGFPITEKNIQRALAMYIRSLTGLNSRFDKYMRGDTSALSQEELSGFNLFMGKAKCGTCHFMPLFNGSVPPLYKETEAEVIGVPAKLATSNAIVDNDGGKFSTFPHPLFQDMFKTPTLRNAAITSPYMHNGAYKTLEQVVDFYNRGGGAGIGVTLKNQTLPPDQLNLSDRQQKDLVAFIHSLTDTTGLTSRPKRLPTFSEDSLNKRRVGGDY